MLDMVYICYILHTQTLSWKRLILLPILFLLYNMVSWCFFSLSLSLSLCCYEISTEEKYVMHSKKMGNKSQANFEIWPVEVCIILKKELLPIFEIFLCLSYCKTSSFHRNLIGEWVNPHIYICSNLISLIWINLLVRFFFFFLRGTVGQLVRALAFSARGPGIKICTEPKKYYVTTDWLRMLCAWARHFTLICLVHLSASRRYHSWENITI